MRPVLFSLFFLSFPLFSFAQFTGAINTGLAVELSPTHPSPNEGVTVSLNDYGGGAFGATIDWYYNDSRIDWAYNQRTITITAPNVTDTATIKAVLTKPNGATETVSKTITPYYLDVILEPQTHVPSFFKGRALPSVGSTVNATALLSGTELISGDYLYTWRINNTVIQGGPLRGGNRVSFEMPQDSYSTLSVTVTKLDGTVLAKRLLAVPVVMPKLLFYEVSTLYGMIPRAIKSPYVLFGNGATLRAEPYHLDSAVFNNPSVISWQVDNTPVSGGNNPYDINLERTETGGSATLLFRAQSTQKLLQGVKGELLITVI